MSELTPYRPQFCSLLRGLGEVYANPRPLADYQAMFALTNDTVKAARILDCPAGVSPFGAQVRALGGTVTSVDPAYALSADQLEARAHGDLHRIFHDAGADPFTQQSRGPLSVNRAEVSASIDSFLTDYVKNAECYTAARLPELPFPDNSFDLALSGNLLFAHPGQLDENTTIEFLAELLRVACEVRIFPVTDRMSVPHPLLDSIVDTLRVNGVIATTLDVPYRLQCGGTRMLRCASGTLSSTH
ncbi:class I SAM-dependent methyltransferase [Lentzea sp. NPDC102401]|uniref:class I SAM-dependent methyltransferase n=1 Tax=Lentzea sp. NPDC102401 TaxID=3364128 RepID=UPI003817B359